MDLISSEWKRYNRAGAKYRTKYEQEGDARHLSDSIANFQKALDLCPPGHILRPFSLNELACVIRTRYEREGHLVDLKPAIQYHMEALELCPPRHSSRSVFLNNLANAMHTRYNREGDVNDLSLTIQCHKEALDLRPLGRHERSTSLSNLANAIRTRYQREGNMEDLTLSIQYHKEALDLRPHGHPDRSASLNNLANALQTRHKRDGDLNDLILAIQYHQEALDLRPLGDPDRSASLNNLANAIWTQYESEGDLDDLSLAIEHRKEALKLCPLGHSSQSHILMNLATTIRTRYERNGTLDDLNLAIQYHKQAVDLRPLGHPGRSSALGGLANGIRARYEQEGDPEDLSLVIQYQQEDLDLIPPGNPERSISLNNLANTLRTRYDCDGDLNDLSLAIQYHQEALDLRPLGHPGRPASLNNLATVLRTRYEREEDLNDLKLAVQYHEEALGLRPLGHRGRSAALTNLANAVWTRYRRSGDLGDLILAIRYHQEDLDICSPGHPGRVKSLNNLANALHTQYQRERDLDSLTLAIQHYEEALGLCSLTHRGRPASLNNLASALQTRYEHEGNLDDLTLAIQYHEKALELRPLGHPDRSNYLCSLARALLAQYPIAQGVHHSMESTIRGQRAAVFEPSEYTEDPSYERDSRKASKDRIISLLRDASQSANDSPKDCLRASLSWVEISKVLEPNSTLAAYTSALLQLDIVVALGESLTQRHDRLLSDGSFEKIKDLATDAAVWTLQHADLPQAIELLEQGRSLLLAQIGRFRVEVDDLRLADPELANRFVRLSRLLDASIVSNQKLEEPSATIRDPYERYRKVSTEWTRTVEEIRKLRKFETFLKPTPYEKLRQAAAEGPIIILIPHKEGSVALIVLSDAPIHHIDLPQATSNRLSELSNNFTHALNYKDYTDAQRERECVDNLASLWSEVVGPVAQVLQYDLAIPLRSRVWWCPISAACFLPLHAAGLYAKGKTGENFLDKYISSYTTTLQALLRARRTNSTAPKRLLVISQPHTPDEPPLPYARDEADKIEKIMSSNSAEPPTTMTSLASEAGTCEAVQREMTSHPWIHFICHGVQAAKHPLDSYLSLHDGHLTLRKIIEQNLPNADFAFLAACHSAAGDKDLANEALHLAAAMQFAGFRGVIGTLWKMRDVDGPPLAEAFYKDMVKRGDHRRAAVALSKAINQLRRNRVPIHCWMRFVHIGA